MMITSGDFSSETPKGFSGALGFISGPQRFTFAHPPPFPLGLSVLFSSIYEMVGVVHTVKFIQP